jgi:predicted transcriptional regulator
MGTPQHLNVNVKLRIDEELQLALERLAILSDRTVAAEMRRALRAHVRAAEEQEAT